MTSPISIKLLNYLARGVQSLGEEARQRVTAFVESQLSAGGGFCDKSGRQDIYYTSFGMLLALVLGIKLDTMRMDDYLQQIDADNLDLVHYAAYKRCCMLNHLAKSKVGFAVKALQREPIRELTSFVAYPNNDMFSPYSQFIIYSLLEDTNNPTPQVALNGYRTADGYTNTPNGQAASTNATAAALMIKGQSEGYDNTEAMLLRNMQHECGGFKAEPTTPMPDLLSTATALFTLSCYNVMPQHSASEFIEAHWLDSGGFAATILDSESDVEYTFYGLLALGTL
ncbi:MAG: hypothetical protein J6C45_03255 [Alistipes sp.]|nr:hypothetical protein [Alistipes sp.]